MHLGKHDIRVYFASFAISIIVFGLMLWRLGSFDPSKNASNDIQAHLLVALMIYVVMVVPAAASTAETKRSAAVEDFSLKPGEKTRKRNLQDLCHQRRRYRRTLAAAAAIHQSQWKNLRCPKQILWLLLGFPNPRKKRNWYSLRNVIDHHELPVIEKEAPEFTAVTRNSRASSVLWIKPELNFCPAFLTKQSQSFRPLPPKGSWKRPLLPTSLRTAVSAWCGTKRVRQLRMGTYQQDTSEVTDMSNLFDDYCSSKSTFNSDISNWDGSVGAVFS